MSILNYNISNLHYPFFKDDNSFLLPSIHENSWIMMRSRRPHLSMETHKLALRENFLISRIGDQELLQSFLDLRKFIASDRIYDLGDRRIASVEALCVHLLHGGGIESGIVALQSFDKPLCGNLFGGRSDERSDLIQLVRLHIDSNRLYSILQLIKTKEFTIS